MAASTPPKAKKCGKDRGGVLMAFIEWLLKIIENFAPSAPYHPVAKEGSTESSAVPIFIPPLC
ncbi:hypothetical protein [Novosphingobium sp.]|uniref:hypothetical protein n=1 Tax=Novosphingobium sp. TaxID=1874826 RepID=UPI002FD87F58